MESPPTSVPAFKDPETHESRWVFSVAGKEASQSFLLVGTVKEPKVGSLDQWAAVGWIGFPIFILSLSDSFLKGRICGEKLEKIGEDETCNWWIRKKLQSFRLVRTPMVSWCEFSKRWGPGVCAPSLPTVLPQTSKKNIEQTHPDVIESNNPIVQVEKESHG